MDNVRDTLCWKCQRALGFCSWSRNFVPVKGWTAKPTLIKQKEGNYTKSYCVEKCPQFIKEER